MILIRNHWFAVTDKPVLFNVRASRHVLKKVLETLSVHTAGIAHLKVIVLGSVQLNVVASNCSVPMATVVRIVSAVQNVRT